MDNLIILKQLPIIEEQLATLKQEIQSQVEQALSLAVTDETIKEVKKTRAELTKDFTALEERRKHLKAAIMQPYEAFEAIYKDCVSDIYKYADTTLKSRVDEVENERKAQKKAEIEEYFNELQQVLNIDIVNFEQWNPNITLSTAVSNYKKQAKEYLEGIANDIAAIETMEDSVEILVEYKQNLNLSSAIAIVKNRKMAIENQKRLAEEMEARKQAEQAAIAKVDEVAAPITPPIQQPQKPEKDPEEVISVMFMVTGKRRDVRELAGAMKQLGIEYKIL